MLGRNDVYTALITTKQNHGLCAVADKNRIRDTNKHIKSIIISQKHVKEKVPLTRKVQRARPDGIPKRTKKISSIIVKIKWVLRC
jgi:hypothetical protein